MNRKLIFETESDNEPYDMQELKRVLMADDLCSALWTLLAGPETPDSVRDFTRELLAEEGINLYEIWR